MKQLSVVIVCKNEEKIIGKTIQSTMVISDDILCVDTGSTDQTKNIIQNLGARLEEVNWQGYGTTRNIALKVAKYDWILMLDADEPLDDTLKNSILREPLDNPLNVYKVLFQTYFIGRRVRFGEWGRREYHIRLFHRQTVQWEDVQVHEQLVLSAKNKIIKLKGHIHHYTVDTLFEYKRKIITYATLNAQKYFAEGRKAGFVKLYLSPLISFLLNYIFRLGFLDGQMGFVIAKMNARYTYLKYAKLAEMHQNANESNQKL